MHWPQWFWRVAPLPDLTAGVDSSRARDADPVPVVYVDCDPISVAPGPWDWNDPSFPPAARDPRRAYRVVDDFESELAAWTGAPFAVAVDSCTNALLLALVYERIRREREFLDQGHLPPPDEFRITLPRRTYVGVLQAVRNAGWGVQWARADWHWRFKYDLSPTRVVDAARHLAPDTYEPGRLTCLSFHAAKQLPLGRGGAILTDDAEAATWLRAARMDGRPPGAPIGETVFPGFHVPMPPPTAALGLWILSRWADSGFVPAPLPDDPYPDLSTLEAR